MVSEIMREAMDTVIFDRFCQNKKYWYTYTSSWSLDDFKEAYADTNNIWMEDYLGKKSAVDWGQRLSSNHIYTPSAMVEAWHDDFISECSDYFLDRFLEHSGLSAEGAEELDEDNLLIEMVQYLNARYLTVAFSHAEYIADAIGKTFTVSAARQKLKASFLPSMCKGMLDLYECETATAADYSRIIKTTDTTDEDLIAWMEGTLPC